MPDEIQPPKTVAEVGIHLVYLSKSIGTMQKMLEEMRDGSVTRIEFDEHVTWGKDVVETINKRITVIEKSLEAGSASLMSRVSRSLDKKIVGLIVFVLSATFIYAAYMIVQNNFTTTRTPEVQVIDGK